MAGGELKDLSEREILLVLSQDVRGLRREFDSFRSELDNYMNRTEIQLRLGQIEDRLKLIERIAFGAVGTLAGTVLLAIVGLVISSGVAGP